MAKRARGGRRAAVSARSRSRRQSKDGHGGENATLTGKKIHLHKVRKERS